GTRSIGKAFKEKGHEVYSVEWDKQHKNIDLYADIATVTSQQILEEFGKPDIIWASPPCESWSVASAMKDGNASRKQEKGDSLFSTQTPLSRFTIRGYKDYEPANVQFKYDRSFVNRINGELCTYNTIKIIKHFKPKYYIIENPATSRMWEYIEKIIG